MLPPGEMPGRIDQLPALAHDLQAIKIVNSLFFILFSLRGC